MPRLVSEVQADLRRNQEELSEICRRLAAMEARDDTESVQGSESKLQSGTDVPNELFYRSHSPDSSRDSVLVLVPLVFELPSSDSHLTETQYDPENEECAKTPLADTSSWITTQQGSPLASSVLLPSSVDSPAGSGLQIRGAARRLSSLRTSDAILRDWLLADATLVNSNRCFRPFIPSASGAFYTHINGTQPGMNTPTSPSTRSSQYNSGAQTPAQRDQVYNRNRQNSVVSYHRTRPVRDLAHVRVDQDTRVSTVGIPPRKHFIIKGRNPRSSAATLVRLRKSAVTATNTNSLGTAHRHRHRYTIRYGERSSYKDISTTPLLSVEAQAATAFVPPRPKLRTIIKHKLHSALIRTKSYLSIHRSNERPSQNPYTVVNPRSRYTVQHGSVFDSDLSLKLARIRLRRAREEKTKRNAAGDHL